MTDPKIFNSNLVDAGEGNFENSDPEVLKAKANFERKALDNSGIVLSLRDMYFANSNLPQEIVELEGHMRAMLLDKQSPKYIRDFVISMGYGHTQFSQVFKTLTGVAFGDYMDETYTLGDVPGCIPGITYGWGPSKDSEYDYYFIQPWNTGYSIFGQKGDLIRKEANFELTLANAREWLVKHTKEQHILGTGRSLEVTDKELNENKVPRENLAEPASRLSIVSSDNPEFVSLDNWVYENINELPAKKIKAAIINTYRDKKIDHREFLELWASYGFLRTAEEGDNPEPVEEEPSAVEKDLTDNTRQLYKEKLGEPFEIDKEDQTPSDFFERERGKSKFDTAPAEYIDKATRFIKEKNEALVDFDIFIENIKYKTIDIAAKKEKALDLDDQGEKDFFSSHAVLSMILRIRDNTLNSSNNEKWALSLFMVIKGDIVAPDLIKGEDAQLYALTEEGLSAYFSIDREKAGH